MTTYNDFCKLLRLATAINYWGEVMFCYTTNYSQLGNVLNSSEIGLNMASRSSLAMFLQRVCIVFWLIPSDSRLMIFQSYLSMVQSIIIWISERFRCNLLLSARNLWFSSDISSSPVCSSFTGGFVVSYTIVGGSLFYRSRTRSFANSADISTLIIWALCAAEEHALWRIS